MGRALGRALWLEQRADPHIAISWGCGRWSRAIEALAYPGIYPVLFFPLPIITILGLYWVRWLAVRPRGTVMDELRKRGEL
jgi:hypothetical protein